MTVKSTTGKIISHSLLNHFKILKNLYSKNPSNERNVNSKPVYSHLIQNESKESCGLLYGIGQVVIIDNVINGNCLVAEFKYNESGRRNVRCWKC